jgi:hypothetical protein
VTTLHGVVATSLLRVRASLPSHPLGDCRQRARRALNANVPADARAAAEGAA